MPSAPHPMVRQGALQIANRFRDAGFRAVPGCFVRGSAYIAPNVVLMPSVVNVGAYVDSGTMVDTWSTVGSCAQIGKNRHLSGRDRRRA
jgi:2,3,4,5-tetrahydropyridine-2,6-dicarboxylate N-succinyltransferase